MKELNRTENLGASSQAQSLSNGLHIEEIKSLLSNFTSFAAEMGLKGDSNWTYEIKQRMGKLGEEQGYKVCTSGFSDFYEREWLYDMVWYKESGEGEEARLEEIPLVLESEWNLRFDHIKYDFEKLLVANANLRVMICYATPERRGFLLDYFNDAILKYRRGKSGDAYLIAMLDYDTNEFWYDVLIR